MTRASLLLALAVLCASGCSHIRVTPTSDTSKEPGVRFYAPRPYLLVTMADSVKEGAAATGYIIKVVYLPDVRHHYRAEYVPGLGSFEGGIKLIDGWQLTDYNVKADTKIPETIGAITGLIKEMAALPPSVIPGGAADFRPGLYRMDFDPSTGTLSKLEYVKLDNGN